MKLLLPLIFIAQVFAIHCAIIPDGVYIIKAKNTGMVLDIYGALTTNFIDLIIYPVHYGTNQQFRITSVGNGLYTIHPVHCYKALSVPNFSEQDVDIVQLDVTGDLNQQWEFVEKKDGFYMIRSKSSGKVLEAPLVSAEAVPQKRKACTDNQLFSLQKYY